MSAYHDHINSTAHTPTPWTLHQDPSRVVGGQGLAVATTFDSDDAAHIVHCVNAHEALIRERDALIEALESVRDQCINAVSLGATGPGFYEDLLDTTRSVYEVVSIRAPHC